MMKIKPIFAFINFIIFFIPLVSAISEEALDVNKTLVTAEKDMEEMMKLGLPVTRYNDTFILVKQMYEAQLVRENTSEKTDYSLIRKKIEELKEIKQNAFTASDELKTLEQVMSQTEGIDMTPVLNIYQEAKNEFDSERYEECSKLIDKTYEKISELEALQTKVKAFYEATSRSVINFLREQWMELSSGVAGSFVGFVLSYNPSIKWATKKKIESLEKRKESIRKLIEKTQKEFFEKGEMSENTYHMRIKKYGEVMRDLNRQIPLLNEELEMRKKKRFFIRMSK